MKSHKSSAKPECWSGWRDDIGSYRGDGDLEKSPWPKSGYLKNCEQSRTMTSEAVFTLDLEEYVWGCCKSANWSRRDAYSGSSKGLDYPNKTIRSKENLLGCSIQSPKIDPALKSCLGVVTTPKTLSRAKDFNQLMEKGMSFNYGEALRKVKTIKTPNV